MTVFVTADTHFYHKNIITHCDRPFESSQDMTDKLIENWNEVVGKLDFVWHLGDFFWGKRLEHARSVVRRLNGKIFVLPGNHDNPRFIKACGLELMDPVVEMKIEGDYCVLCHYPIEDWANRQHGSLHLHGHSHGRSRAVHNRMDVGVDCWNYRPIHIVQAVAAAKDKALAPLVDPLSQGRYAHDPV